MEWRQVLIEYLTLSGTELTTFYGYIIILCGGRTSRSLPLHPLLMWSLQVIVYLNKIDSFAKPIKLLSLCPAFYHS